MSNFCGIISKSLEKASSTQAPFTFEQLDHLIVELSKQNDEALLDFERKSKAVVEDDKRVMENNELLTDLAEKLKLLQQNFNILEVEITANETELGDIGKIAAKLENRYLRKGNINFKSMRADLLSFIETLNVKMLHEEAEIDDLKTTIGLEEQVQPAVVGVVVEILNQHFEVLRNTEKNLENLTADCENVQIKLEFLRRAFLNELLEQD